MKHHLSYPVTRRAISRGAAKPQHPPKRSFSNGMPAVKLTKRFLTQVHSSLPNPTYMDYSRGWAWQQALLSRRIELRRRAQLQAQNSNDPPAAIIEDADVILLLEHSPVYTLGRGADENHLTFLSSSQPEEDNNESDYRTKTHNPNQRFYNPEECDQIRQKLSRKQRGPDSARLSVDRRSLEEELMNQSLHQAVDMLTDLASPVIAPNGVPIYRVDRGGEVTYHGPQQLVCYPLVDLQRAPYQKDLHWFLRCVEEIAIQTLREYEIESVRDSINTGVWVGENKIAAVGVSSSRWITTHGFALNVAPDLDFFDTSVILPCGIEGRGVTSIQQVLHQRGESHHCPSMENVASVVLQKVEEIFEIELSNGNTLT